MKSCKIFKPKHAMVDVHPGVPGAADPYNSCRTKLLGTFIRALPQNYSWVFKYFVTSCNMVEVNKTFSYL